MLDASCLRCGAHYRRGAIRCDNCRVVTIDLAAMREVEHSERFATARAPRLAVHWRMNALIFALLAVVCAAVHVALIVLCLVGVAYSVWRSYQRIEPRVATVIGVATMAAEPERRPMLISLAFVDGTERMLRVIGAGIVVGVIDLGTPMIVWADDDYLYSAGHVFG